MIFLEHPKGGRTNARDIKTQAAPNLRPWHWIIGPIAKNQKMEPQLSWEQFGKSPFSWKCTLRCLGCTRKVVLGTPYSIHCFLTNDSEVLSDRPDLGSLPNRTGCRRTKSHVCLHTGRGLRHTFCPLTCMSEVMVCHQQELKCLPYTLWC